MRRMPVSLHYLNRTMNTGDEGAALRKRIKSDKVVVFSPLKGYQLPFSVFVELLKPQRPTNRFALPAWRQ